MPVGLYCATAPEDLAPFPMWVLGWVSRLWLSLLFPISVLIFARSFGGGSPTTPCDVDWAEHLRGEICWAESLGVFRGVGCFGSQPLGFSWCGTESRTVVRSRTVSTGNQMTPFGPEHRSWSVWAPRHLPACPLLVWRGDGLETCSLSLAFTCFFFIFLAFTFARQSRPLTVRVYRLFRDLAAEKEHEKDEEETLSAKSYS